MCPINCDITEVGKVQFCPKYTKLLETKYEAICEIQATDPTSSLNSHWKASILLQPWSVWSWMMQAVHMGDHPGKSEVVFLPMINMDPTDMSCMFSAVKFLSKQALKYSSIPVRTFDKPWWKALLIVSNSSSEELRDVVL
jgi:hypothetical protein